MILELAGCPDRGRIVGSPEVIRLFSDGPSLGMNLLQQAALKLSDSFAVCLRPIVREFLRNDFRDAALSPFQGED
jgi:hypothetical protein